jgi:hypothetical protein
MKPLFCSFIAATLAISLPAFSGPPAQVTNGNNEGVGSLRAALSSGATHIVIKPSVQTITVTETLLYSGTKPLTVAGSGQTIDGSGLTNNLASIFEVTNGAKLTIRKMNFDGGGGYSRSVNLNSGVEVSGGKGIFVDVPVDRTGAVEVELTHVSVYGTGNHAIHISDCTLGDECGGRGGGAGNGSPASIRVRLNNVLVAGAGFGKQDADGVRVDDRNDGDIHFSVVNSVFKNIGTDGVELDEGNNGSVYLEVRNTTFEMNGGYCLDGEFIVDDPCYDDGDPNVGDGFSVDEAGPGSVEGSLKNLHIKSNFDEGLDFDEKNDGGFDLRLTSIYAQGNKDQGVEISEKKDGNVRISMRAVTLQGNAVTLQGNEGSKEDVEIEEKDSGDVKVMVNGSHIDKLKISEDGSGDGTVKVCGSTIVEPLDLDNVTEI